MNRKLIIAVALTVLNLIGASLMAQDKVGLAILHDVRLHYFGDPEHDYNKGTLDVILRLKMQGNQQPFGFLIVTGNYEYAMLKQSYVRYSVDVGYTLNKLFLKNFEASLLGGWGIINREGVGSSSLSVIGEIGYKLNHAVKVIINSQLVQRSDIDKWIVSGFVGFELSLS